MPESIRLPASLERVHKAWLTSPELSARTGESANVRHSKKSGPDQIGTSVPKCGGPEPAPRSEGFRASSEVSSRLRRRVATSSELG